MSQITYIKGTIEDDDGKVTEFAITPYLGSQQWGEVREVLGSRVDLIAALASAAEEHLELSA